MITTQKSDSVWCGLCFLYFLLPVTYNSFGVLSSLGAAIFVGFAVPFLCLYAVSNVLKKKKKSKYLSLFLQYEWPKYSSTFEEVLQIIRKQGSFSYPLFCNYVTTPDILEEFMYLATKEGGNLQLDIIPISQGNK